LLFFSAIPLLHLLPLLRTAQSISLSLFSLEWGDKRPKGHSKK